VVKLSLKKKVCPIEPFDLHNATFKEEKKNIQKQKILSLYFLFVFINNNSNHMNHLLLL